MQTASYDTETSGRTFNEVANIRAAQREESPALMRADWTFVASGALLAAIVGALLGGALAI